MRRFLSIALLCACGKGSGAMSLPCDASVCPTLLAYSDFPRALAIDDKNIFFTSTPISNPPSGKIVRLDKNGGMPVTLASGEQWDPSDIAVDGTSVYWANHVFPNDLVMKVDKNGGAPETLVPNTDASAIALDDANVYFGGLAGRLSKVPKAGGTPTMLLPMPISGKGIDSVAVDGANVFFGSNIGQVLMKVDKNGGAPVTLFSGKPVAYIALDANSVYWTSFDKPGTVMKIDKAGGTPVTIAMGQNNPARLAVDSSTVFWTESGGDLFKAPLAGGVPISLASGLSSPEGVAIDDSNVYWANAGGSPSGSIMRMAK